MKALPRVLPVVVVGSFILMSSQLLSAPQSAPLLPMSLGLDTIAHIIFYFSLGFFVCRLLRASVSTHSAVVLGLAVSVSLTFGVVDEFHQMFIPGRSADLNDLLADLAGAASGASMYLAFVGLSEWTKELLSASEIPWTRVLLRGAVAVGGAVAICVLAVVYADSIARVCQALLIEGSLQAQQIVNRYTVPGAPQAADLSKAMMAPPQLARQGARTAQHSPPAEFTTLELAQALEPAGAVRGYSESEAAEQQAATREPREEVTTGSRQQSAEDLERQLLGEMQRILVQLGQLEKMSKTGASSAPIKSDTKKAGDANGAVRERIVQALAARGIDARKFAVSAAVSRQALGSGAKAPDPCDLVAIITSNSNPVHELTVSQARKIFSGEYTNWSQVGGPDLPVKVVTVRKPAGDLEQKLIDHLHAPLSPRAIRLPLVSLIIPVVAQTKGAVGFLPVLNTEQLDFVAGHTAFKRVAIRADGQSPAFEPNRMALSTSDYPIMKALPARQDLVGDFATAAGRGVGRQPEQH
jgi:VanZ family protein